MSTKYQTLNGQIQNARSRVFRKLYIKRRMLGTGLYEDEWQEITEDVVKWGTIKKEIDAARLNVFKFSPITLSLSNQTGRYNPYEDENSIWHGYGDQQRTLVKINAGFIHQTLQDGIWTNIELPGNSYWDEESYWDVDQHLWDSENIVFVGFISGDINISGNNQVNVSVAPLTEAFRLFSARRLTGFTPSLTASNFIELLRDQQDASGQYIFRPFFGDTTTQWDINTTTAIYSNLNTSTAEDVFKSTAWDIIQKLAEAENKVPYVTTDGQFKFVGRDSGTTTVFGFVGAGGFSSEYGTTIKNVTWYGKRYSKYYSRVQIQFRSEDTTSSFAIQESSYAVSGSSTPWTLGDRTLEMTNYWIPTSTVADTLALDIFNEYNALKYEIEFTTSFVPHLNLLDQVEVTYDTSPPSAQGTWDAYNWGDTTTAISPDDLLWDSSAGEALKMYQKQFKLISISINMDTAEVKFIGRE